MNRDIHDFRPILKHNPLGNPVERMECSKCGFWTSDLEVSNDRLISFWTRGDNGPMYVELNCEGYQLNRVVNG